MFEPALHRKPAAGVADKKPEEPFFRPVFNVPCGDTGDRARSHAA